MGAREQQLTGNAELRMMESGLPGPKGFCVFSLLSCQGQMVKRAEFGARPLQEACGVTL